MEIQVDGVHRQGLGKPTDEAAADALEGVARDHAPGPTACPKERNEVMPRFHVLHEARNREGVAGESLHDIGAIYQRRSVAMRCKIGKIGLRIDEAVRLVLEAA